MKEEKATGSKLLDSTILVDYFIEGKHKEIIDSRGTILISALSLFELKKKLLEKKVPKEAVENIMKFVKQRMIHLVVNDAIVEYAAEISINYEISAIDSIIYATALLNSSSLYTLDNDFRGLKSVVLL